MEVSFDSDRVMNLNDDETRMLDEISFSAPAPKKPSILKSRNLRTNPFAKQTPGPPVHSPPPSGEMRDDMDMFMNPGKKTAPPMPPPAEYEDDGEMPDEFEPEHSTEQVPSDGYKTIEDEKADLLNKISRLNKKGIQSSQRLTIYSDIDEIRIEYKRMTYGVEVERSIKFQRRMLVACITGLEFLNDKFDPFDLALDGWSQNCMESVEDYDGVFEDLHNKYKTKINVAPEVKLIMMVGGSAMMFHLTNSMFKSAVPNVNQVMQQNPGLMQNMMDAVQRTQPVPPPTDGKRDMRGPGMDFGSLMNMMGPPPSVQTRAGPSADVESVSDIVSVDDDIKPKKKKKEVLIE